MHWFKCNVNVCFQANKTAFNCKTIENVGIQTDSRFINDKANASGLIHKLNYIDFKKITANLFSVELRIVNHLVNKLLKMYFSIFEYSKLDMFRAYASFNNWYCLANLLF